MAIKTLTLCDACGKQIDPVAGFVNLTTIRGGFTLEVGTQFGSASQAINTTRNFCGPGCLTAFVGKIADTIKPAAAPAAAPKNAA